MVNIPELRIVQGEKVRPRSNANADLIRVASQVSGLFGIVYKMVSAIDRFFRAIKDLFSSEVIPNRRMKDMSKGTEGFEPQTSHLLVPGNTYLFGEEAYRVLPKRGQYYKE